MYITTTTSVFFAFKKAAGVLNWSLRIFLLNLRLRVALICKSHSDIPRHDSVCFSRRGNSFSNESTAAVFRIKSYLVKLDVNCSSEILIAFALKIGAEYFSNHCYHRTSRSDVIVEEPISNLYRCETLNVIHFSEVAVLLTFTTHLRVLASSFLRFRDHTQWHNTVGRTPLYEWSARRRDLYLTNTQHSQQTNIHVPGGIRTRNPSRWAAAHPLLRPFGHWDRHFSEVVDTFKDLGVFFGKHGTLGQKINIHN
jgi:hypothetical protein